MVEQRAVMLTDGRPNNSRPVPPYTILALGFAKWRGSDGRALAQAFRRLGHNLIEVDEEDYVPWRWQGNVTRALRRILSPVWIHDYNQAVLKQASSSAYDFVLVFKGNLLRPETVKSLKGKGWPIYNFYPDVSFQDHGPNIPAALQWYDCVFTTKRYHGKHEMQEFSIRDLQHVRHGFDPEVHRPVAASPDIAARYASDVSFVGCWSPEKEEKLLYLLRHLPELSVKVFGLGWKYASSEFKDKMGTNLRPGAFGDELAMVYCASKVNLGLLSCSKSNPKLQDQTTARTFQIPATKSFMLHEDTPEVRTFFKDPEEVVLFSNNEDLVKKVRAALTDPDLRRAISQKGFVRSVSEPYDYSSAAQSILGRFEAGH